MVDVPAPEVIENMVGTTGLEPATSTVSIRHSDKDEVGASGIKSHETKD